MASSSPAPLDPSRGTPFAWHHLRGVVPADWEVSRYSVEDRDGRLEFANRRGLQALASWEPCEQEPDRPTTMATFLANNLVGRRAARARGLRATDIRTAEAGPFVLGWLDDDLPVQALAYDRAEKRLIRWVFEGRASARDRREVVEPILLSCDFNDDPDVCEYRLYGIHAVLPREYRIEDIVVLPANVMMAFEGEESHARAVFRRWGLASSLLDGEDLGDFYARVVRTNRYEVLSCERREAPGIDLRLVRFSAPREFHGDRFMARRWKNGRAYVWHDAATNRIHAFEQVGPRRAAPLPPSTVPDVPLHPFPPA